MENIVDLSILVPVYNEEDNVLQLHGEIVSVCRDLGLSFEIIFINDGSDDGTLENMINLSPLVILNLRKNFGQTAALDAGIKAARGSIIITMDGDLQNDPADIPKLLDKIYSGYDVVSGWRKNRQDSLMKKIISRGAHYLRHLMINDGIHDSGCSLKAYRRECFEGVDLHGEMHRFVPALLKIKGYRIGEITVNHRARLYGKTKYGLSRTVKGFLDMASVWFWKKFANRPLHLFGTFGVFLIFVSFVSGAYAVYKKLFTGLDLSDTLLSSFSMFAFLIGIQFIVFGLLADMLSKNYYACKNCQPYEVKEILINDEKARSHGNIRSEVVENVSEIYQEER